MRKRVVVAAILALVVMVGTVSAQSALPGSGWWSGEQIQNVGSASAQIDILVYDKDSVETYPASAEVGEGEAFTFTPFVGLTNLPDQFQGSAVVRANQPIKAIVNVTNNPVGDQGIDGGTAAGQYQGVTGESVARKLYFPLVKGGYYNNTTTFYIQNAGSSPASFVAEFTMGDGRTHVYTYTNVGVGRLAVFSVFDTATFDLDPLAPNSLDEARKGGLIVTADMPIAGVVMEHATAEHPAKVVYATRGFTESDFDDRAYAPVIKDMFYGAFTGIQVQNVNETGPIDVTVIFNITQGPNAGEVIEQKKEGIPAGSSHTFVQLSAAPNNSPLPMENLASVVIEATGGQFVAIVNETNGNATAGITYSAIPERATTQQVSAPLFKDYYYGATSGLQIQNVGAMTATKVVADFACSVVGGTTFRARSKPQTIGPGSAVLFFHPFNPAAGHPEFEGTMTFIAERANCSVTITGDQKVVAIVNEMGVTDGYGYDFYGVDDNNYEGFNLQ